MFMGTLLILLGILFLLKNLGILSGNLWDVFWPLILIALGLSILLKREKGSREK